MPAKRYRFFFFCFVFVFLVLFLGSAGLFFYLPVYVETDLIPKLAKDFGVSLVRCDVRRIGLNGADLGSIIIAGDEGTGLSVGSVQIDYSPIRLYRKSVKKILISGIELHPEFKDGSFSLSGFDRKKVRSGTSPQNTSPPIDIWPGFSIPRIEIRNAVAVFQWENNPVRLPFELEITPENGGGNLLKCSIRIYPFGREITASIDLDLKKKKLHATVNATDLAMECFTRFTGRIQGLILSGTLDFKADAEMDLENFEIVSASGCLEFSNDGSSFKNFILQNSPEEAPVSRFNIHKIAGNQWKISGTSVAFTSPVPLQIFDLAAELTIAQDAMDVSGSFLSSLLSFNENQAIPFNLMDPVCLRWNLGFKASKGGEWEFRAAAEMPAANGPARTKPITLFLGADRNFTIASKTPRIDIFGKGRDRDGSVGCKIDMANVSMSAEPAKLHIPVLTLSGRADLGGLMEEEKNFADFELIARNGDLSIQSTRMKIPHVSLSGKLRKNKDASLGLDGLGKITKAAVTDSQLKTKVLEISGQFPIQWPFTGSNSRGSVSINGINVRNLDIGSVRGTIRQTDFGFVFDATHKNRLIPALSLKLTGKSNIVSTKDRVLACDFELLHPQPAPDIDLGRLFPNAGGIKGNGDLTVNGAFIADKTGIKSPVNVRLKKAKVSDEARRLAIEDIDLALAIPDLFDFRSKPRQQAVFAKASYGDLKLNDGTIEFQIESDGSIFIENSDFKWCGGKVYTQALRISPGIEDYNVILYCDRLNLAQVLEQFGLSNAQGQGTVNGRIPLRLKDGKIRFNDGFLFTTPGEGGTIKVTGTEILTSGIPPDTLQYTQIELAREALKDFQYQWAKLSILTEGENLRLHLQFDGKPAHPLPFVYKKDFGGFVKVEAGGEGSIFQGIRLDVNFKFPLDKIMRHKGILQMIQ